MNRCKYGKIKKIGFSLRFTCKWPERLLVHTPCDSIFQSVTSYCIAPFDQHTSLRNVLR